MKKYIFLFTILTLVFISCENEEPVPTYTLTTNVTPTEGGKITISPQSQNYKEGEVVTLTPEPNEHWVFQNWDGDASGSTSPLQVTMNANKSVTGTFINRNYQLTITIEGEGTVEESIITNPSGREYPHGTTVELTPVPKEGWMFESWGGDLTGSETPKTITVDKEKNVTAKFKRAEYKINFTIEGEGTVEEKIVSSPSGREYPFQTVVELTPVPIEGWVFDSWEGDLIGSESPQTITVDKEKNVTVKFIRNQTVTSLNCSSAINNGTLTPEVPVTGDVNSVIPYSGAFGGTYSGQTVTSTGVTGLTAILEAGTFANGSGSVTYAITGTPSAAGTASFAINIGGQTCTLTRTVSTADQEGPTIVIDVTNPITGRTWMDRNLGATQAATSSTDAASYGDLYQWGRRSDGHQLRNSATTTTLSSIDQPAHGSFITINSGNYDWRSPQNTNLWQGVDGVNNPCPSGYRLPTVTELNSERLSWSANTSAGAFASPLKLPMAGGRSRIDGSLGTSGTYGSYWSSTVSGTDSNYLNFGSINALIFTGDRAIGLSVRCLKD